MGLRCRKGDMAISIDTDSMTFGMIVEVGEFVGKCRVHSAMSDRIYVADDAWEITYPNMPSVPESTGKWVLQDRHMIPIRPGDLHETEETEKELTV